MAIVHIFHTRISWFFIFYTNGITKILQFFSMGLYLRCATSRSIVIQMFLLLWVVFLETSPCSIFGEGSYSIFHIPYPCSIFPSIFQFSEDFWGRLRLSFSSCDNAFRPMLARFSASSDDCLKVKVVWTYCESYAPIQFPSEKNLCLISPMTD